MSVRGKEVRPLIDADMHERLAIIADFERIEIAQLSSRLLEQAIAGEWYRFERLIERIQNLSAEKDNDSAPAGFVYIIRIGGRYKIGKAVDWQKRLSNAMFPEPPEVVCIIESDNHHQLEQELHRKYSSVRLHGEWFGLLPEHIEEIRSLPGAGNPT